MTEWGYPYVFEEFKFHMTLTRRLEANEHDAVFALASEYFADAVNQPLNINALTIFTQTDPNSHFKVKNQFALVEKELVTSK